MISPSNLANPGPSPAASRSCGRRQVLRALTVTGPALLAPLVTGCRTSLVRRSVQRRLERRLHSVIGPAERYRVRILDTPEAELVLGRARRVEIEGRKINVQRQLLVDSFRVVFFDLRYEGGEPYFVSIRRSDLEIEITEEAINQYLQAYQSRYSPVLRLEPDRVEVRMVYRFLGQPTDLRATGRLHVREGRQLLFDAASANVSFISDPAFAERFVEDRVNPLLDLSRVDFPARLEHVQVLQGRIRAGGSASLPPEPRD